MGAQYVCWTISGDVSDDEEKGTLTPEKSLSSLIIMLGLFYFGTAHTDVCDFVCAYVNGQACSLKTYIILNKPEGCTERMSARRFENTSVWSN